MCALGSYAFGLDLLVEDWILDWIALDRHWIGTGSALDQHWIHEILAAAGRAADWIGTGSVLDRYWIGTGSVLDLYWIGLDRTGSDWI